MILAVQVMVGVGLSVNVGKFTGVAVGDAPAVGPGRVTSGDTVVAVAGTGVFVMASPT